MKFSSSFALLGLFASAAFGAPSSKLSKEVNVFEQKSITTSAVASIAPPLAAGMYMITSPSLGSDLCIGRRLAEDRSLLPKRVATVFKNERTQWNVQPLENGKYTLTVAGLSTGVNNNKLYALIIEMGFPKEDWTITQTGHDTYMILTSDESRKWIANSDTDEQVAVQPTRVYAGDAEVFQFIRLDGETDEPEILQPEGKNIKIDITIGDM